MRLTLTTLAENTAAGPGCAAEWGWSIFVQAGDLKILFDTGAGLAAARNAEQAGISFGSLDKVLLSHAHADHTGGLREVLQRADRPEVIAHPAIWVPKFKKTPTNDTPVYNGIPYARQEMEKLGAFTLSKDPVRISENLITTGEVPRKTDFETIETQFFVEKGDSLVPDDFPDDRALICKTPKGLVIVLGCAHRGIVNTILQAQEITGENRVHAVIGGTHLYPKNDDQVAQTIRSLNGMGIQRIGVSHCTGFRAAAQLAQAFGEKFFLNNAGSQITFE